jgi:addiction module HigA family antidote
MPIANRKPATVGAILVEKFLKPLGLTQAALARAMGMPRKHGNELCNDRRAPVFGNSPDFWLNVQRRTDLWTATHSPRERARIARAKPAL